MAVKRYLTGFALFEAILVVVIMGILAALALPRLSQRRPFYYDLVLRSTVSEIAADIKYTRSLAITNSGCYLINFDLARREYAIFKDSLSNANQIGETRKISDKVGFSATSSSRFEFYSLGNAAYSGPGLEVARALAGYAYYYRISVEPPTGIVFVEKVYVAA